MAEETAEAAAAVKRSGNVGGLSIFLFLFLSLSLSSLLLVCLLLLFA